MSPAHIVLLTTSQETMASALKGQVVSKLGDVLFDHARHKHCPGPEHPNLLTLIVAADACAEALCHTCDLPVCASCDASFSYNIDTETAVCENCEGKPIWNSLAELANETAPRLIEVVYGCYACGGEETPENTATVLVHTEDSKRARHWLCRSCMRRLGPQRALSQLTHLDRHPGAQERYNGTSPSRLVPAITQGLNQTNHETPSQR